MFIFIRYVKRRYFYKSHGWGKTWCKWLWLDAVLFATARTATLYSPKFYLWCRSVNKIFRERFDWPRNMTDDTGKDCWIDAYWQGDSPEKAVLDEVDCWD